jgi:ABC-type transporter Mla subunit MlaD
MTWWSRFMALAISQPDMIASAKIVAEALNRNTQGMYDMIEALQTFKVAVDDAFTKVSHALDASTQAYNGLAGDITSLKDQIAQLIASPTLGEDDKAAINAVLDSANALAAKADTVAQNLAALDALTTPPAPPSA